MVECGEQGAQASARILVVRGLAREVCNDLGLGLTSARLENGNRLARDERVARRCAVDQVVSLLRRVVIRGRRGWFG